MKRTSVFVLFILMILLFSGCVQDNKTSEQTNSGYVQDNNTSKQTNVNQNENQYQTAEYSFSVPESWKGKFTAKSLDDRTSFFHTATYNVNSQGWLLDICRTKVVGDWEEYPDYKYIGCADGTYYFMIFPTDVQFAEGNNGLIEEYSKMEKDIDGIIDSFVL